MAHSTVVVWIQSSLCPQRSFHFVDICYEMPSIKRKIKKTSTYEICRYYILSSVRGELGSLWSFQLFCSPVSFRCPCWWNLTGSQLLKKIHSFNSPRPASQGKRLGRWDRGWETRPSCWAQACLSRMTSYLGLEEQSLVFSRCSHRSYSR